MSAAGCAVSIFAASLLPPIPPGATVPIVLSFDYPTNAMDTNLVFQVRGTSDLSALFPWGVESSIAAASFWTTNGWNLPLNGTNYTITFTNLVVPGPHFWTFNASNFWGELSNPSSVVTVPPLPVTTLNAKAKRGW